MPINNSWYDDLGDGWWDSNGALGLLHEMNPARFGYFSSVLGRLAGLKILDVGCGGGILAESFARAGASVTGVDLSHASLLVAKRHVAAGGLNRVDLVTGRAESLPFLDSSFDAALSTDFLEHVGDVPAVVGECARILKPSGTFLYETINRTLRSRVIVIWLLERVLRLIPSNTHDARMFIKPEELHEAMARNGLQSLETRGLAPKTCLAGALYNLIKQGRVGQFTVTGGASVSYIGYGVKAT